MGRIGSRDGRFEKISDCPAEKVSKKLGAPDIEIEPSDIASGFAELFKTGLGNAIKSKESFRKGLFDPTKGDGGNRFGGKNGEPLLKPIASNSGFTGNGRVSSSIRLRTETERTWLPRIYWKCRI